MTRYVVTYASGRHLTVIATDTASACKQGALLWPDDPVIEVRLW